MKYTSNRNYRDYNLIEEDDELIPVKKSILLKKKKSLLQRLFHKLNPFKK